MSWWQDLESPDQLIALLQYLPGMGARQYLALIRAGITPEQLLQTTESQLRSLLPPKLLSSLLELRQRGATSDCWLQFNKDLALLDSIGAEIITHTDDRYPQLLKDISDYPPALYVLGNSDALSQPQLAVVGSRNMTRGGADNAFRFSACLAQAGFTITSGLAAGIDARAHEGALSVGGHTIAVMATGIDRVYPSRHRQLADSIIAGGGCLITEFIPGTAPLARHFPSRNRIVSGLSLRVLVVEAAPRSGSLITARLALEQGREVFSIPGSIHNPQSRGCHDLIRQGATLVETASDIAEELQGWCSHQPALSESWPSQPHKPELDDSEQQLLDALGYDVAPLEHLAQLTGWQTEILLPVLMGLQIKGLVAQQGAGYQRL
ncbi:MAG: DNA-processing protein DprA [Candidatus Pelagadaptatus aseana]|uniref:DNA-processing protein DprA n=1 Tax=Candidatus Pelagadaptatus aseana TaxID=3120508 RepID=UPI0039B26E00